MGEAKIFLWGGTTFYKGEKVKERNSYAVRRGENS